MPVIRVEHCGPDGPFKKYYLDIFSLVIFCLYLTECKLVNFKENYRHRNYVQAFLHQNMVGVGWGGLGYP